MKKFLIFSSVLALPIGVSFYMIKDAISSRFFNSHKNAKKDETRFNTNYYGMNWGSRTDEVVRLLFNYSLY